MSVFAWSPSRRLQPTFEQNSWKNVLFILTSPEWQLTTRKISFRLENKISAKAPNTAKEITRSPQHAKRFQSSSVLAYIGESHWLKTWASSNLGLSWNYQGNLFSWTNHQPLRATFPDLHNSWRREPRGNDRQALNSNKCRTADAIIVTGIVALRRYDVDISCCLRQPFWNCLVQEKNFRHDFFFQKNISTPVILFISRVPFGQRIRWQRRVSLTQHTLEK